MDQTVKIKNEEGLHARPAGFLVKKASQFKSVIEIRANGKTANAKSIMSVMGLGLNKDADVTISAVGVDEKEALDALVGLVERKFVAEA
ncbi:MAG: HPr family phosphocarrier protein [Deltaproteobacteria bacterium]|nr:HPr family phosphocarrier protein [Deltaproteobacteria bacterium]